MKTKLLCYTRMPLEDEIYSARLAYSMHLALREPDGTVTVLNHNSGVLYAKATQNQDGTLNAKSLKEPWLFAMKKGYGVIACRTEAEGGEDMSAAGRLLLFTSCDLIHYRELALLETGTEGIAEKAVCRYLSDAGVYRLLWREKGGRCFAATLKHPEDGVREAARKELSSEAFEAERMQMAQDAGNGLPEGACPGNALEISEEEAGRLKTRFLTPVNVANEVPEQVTVSSPEELKRIRAVARYSDGSSVEKRVDWYADAVDFSTPGCYTAEGRVHQDHYEFPVAWHKADPCIGRWNGRYYFISTNDQDHEHSIYIREADTIPGLVTAQQVKILDAYTYPHLGNLLWAPELHVIGERLYIFHAGTPQDFLDEQSHVMALKEGGNPMIAEDWEMPVRVVRKDGSPLYGKEGITLDMTEFAVRGKHYVCWSQRQFKPVDQGAWLYIACVDPREPWRLTTDPVLLSVPEYGWDNNHTFVDEGPFALIRDGKVYLTFSGAAVDSTYVVGLLWAEDTADLLDPESWVKENCPLLSSRSAAGEFGPGHNAYVTDGDGLVWNTYHARPGVNGPRSAGIRRVHFNRDGFPVLDMTEEKDLVPKISRVRTQVLVKAPQKDGQVQP